ncbi:MAG: precorrin-6A/cobalt-precorrin-6A reductase [Synechococcaceae cyanobacterium]
MHNTPAQQEAGRLWLFTGTGEGPPLARELLAQDWRLRVSVVTAAAAMAYVPHPRLELRVGVLGGAAALTRGLLEARSRGAPFAAVVDATHPFASRIHGELERGSAAAGVPLLRLERDMPAQRPAGRVQELADMAELRGVPLVGTRLLLAIGSRHLGQALRCSPAALHHARVLPTPAALSQALAAGLDPARLAPLHPRPGPELAAGAVEAALLRRWRIEAVLARASGPPTETLWRRLTATQGCRLLLLRRPLPGPGALSHDALVETLAAWRR